MVRDACLQCARGVATVPRDRPRAENDLQLSRPGLPAVIDVFSGFSALFRFLWLLDDRSSSIDSSLANEANVPMCTFNFVDRILIYYGYSNDVDKALREDIDSRMAAGAILKTTGVVITLSTAIFIGVGQTSSFLPFCSYA